MKKYRYSEIFYSFQGEGFYTGIPTIWLRFWGCNFTCGGFGQDNLNDPSSWKLDYQDFDVTNYKSMEELPVWKRGCDSSYSWSKKFAHLAHHKTAEEICNELIALTPTEHFYHNNSQQPIHLAFTGGEPMMNQTAIVDIMKTLANKDHFPNYITIETNGTQMPRKEFEEYFTDQFSGELFWSVSPKLRTSGENWKDAIKPKVIDNYVKISNNGQLKYVVNNEIETWNEVERATKEFRNYVTWPVWIMPVGSLMEDQQKIAADVVLETIKRGYNVSARVHSYVFGNSIGF